MDSETQKLLRQIFKTARSAALGTLRDGAPQVSMILFVPGPDYRAVFFRASRLAQHTQDLQKDGRASILIQEPDDGSRDPQTLARVSLHGVAGVINHEEQYFIAAQQAYLAKYPQAAITLNLGDFQMYRMEIQRARFVAGFGKTFNLKAEDFRQLGATENS